MQGPGVGWGVGGPGFLSGTRNLNSIDRTGVRFSEAPAGLLCRRVVCREE